MKTTWCDKQGSRDRQAVAALVTSDGEVIKFKGESLPKVCAVAVISRSKNGKWSNSTYEITHSEATTVVAWMEDFETGQTFPQASWATGYLWFKVQAPAASIANFDSYVRANYPKTAVRWDSAAAGEVEFSAPATEHQIQQLAAGKVELAALLAKTEADQRLANSLKTQADALEAARFAASFAASGVAKQSLRLAAVAAPSPDAPVAPISSSTVNINDPWGSLSALKL
jgi:hypothetical protein